MEWLGLIFITTALLSIGVILQKNILKKEHTFEFTIIFYFYFVIFIIPSFLKLDFTNYSLFEYSLMTIRAILAGSGFLFLTKAYEKSEISIVSPLTNLTPLFVLILSFFTIGEKITLIEFIGILLLIFGTYFLEVDKKKGFLFPIKKIVKSTAIHYLIFTFIFWSIAIILEKYIMSTIEISPYSFMAISAPITFLWLFSIYIFKNRTTVNLVKSFKKYWAINLMCAGLYFGSMITYLMAVAIPGAKISLITAIKKTSTLLEIAICGNLLHEKHIRKKSIAASIMIAGIFLMIYF